LLVTDASVSLKPCFFSRFASSARRCVAEYFRADQPSEHETTAPNHKASRTQKNGLGLRDNGSRRDVNDRDLGRRGADALARLIRPVLVFSRYAARGHAVDR
jgi:hypothetical protein